MKPTIWQLIAAFILSVGIGAGGAYAYRLIWPQQSQLAKNETREICIGRVTYIQFDNAVVTKLKPDGKVWTCGVCDVLTARDIDPFACCRSPRSTVRTEHNGF